MLTRTKNTIKMALGISGGLIAIAGAMVTVNNHYASQAALNQETTARIQSGILELNLKRYIEGVTLTPGERVMLQRYEFELSNIK